MIELADVKWIKLSVGLPDNRKIKQIRKLPDGDSLALLWVFLMCLAGETNEDGAIYFTPEIPYTDEMLAEEFRMDINTIRLGLKTFQNFGMLEIVDDIIKLDSWEKWQSTDRLSEIREYNRLAKQRSRAKQKQLQSVNDKSMTSQPCQDTDIDIELDIDKNKNRIDYTHIIDMYNDICVSLPRVKSLSDNRKKAIKDRLNSYSIEQFEELFRKAEQSSFLKGANNHNWSANFDWLIKDSNFAKVLDGNYDNKTTNQTQHQSGTGNIFMDMLNERMQKGEFFDNEY